MGAAQNLNSCRISFEKRVDQFVFNIQKAAFFADIVQKRPLPQFVSLPDNPQICRRLVAHGVLKNRKSANGTVITRVSGINFSTDGQFAKLNSALRGLLLKKRGFNFALIAVANRQVNLDAER